ncbi:acyl-CoA dehydratase activase [Ruminococcaceae bacterium OttesenSCG-928-O06]|nr:acyl-CoA dehydratase activase [Ruminococcaceae bacterium OttesenSCG-928-O06]
MKLGLDIGSTTIKCVVLDDDGAILHHSYQRHYSHIIEKAAELLAELEAKYGHTPLQCAISGSAGMGFATACAVPFVQEVFATRIASRSLAPNADVIIELGGEDAKILFLTNGVEVRMNGSCAGGTGAFIDQMATLLKISPEELNEKAKGQEKIYTIASRCGVFAKTDVQPLLNQGARVEDVSASILYSVVNQTIAGLAQGRRIAGNVLYLGGPLTFMSELRAAFDRVLKVQGILPENSLYFVSIGAALYADEAFTLPELRDRLAAAGAEGAHFEHTEPLFRNEAEYAEFLHRHEKASVPVGRMQGYRGRAHLGIDAGSTTVKTVLLSEDGELLNTTYQPNSGNPVPLVRAAMLEMYAACPDMTLASVTTTGYGEALCKEAFNADYSLVETMAHFRAARHFAPDVDFIIDIGGQDMKCFKIEDGAISDIFLNEACSSGCGSFLQTFAEALGQDVRDFAKLGLFGDAPVELGSRCTVFMNSSVKQAQKDGASIENISAGLAISVVKNALYKVIRVSSPEELGKNVVVQGGTFYNDAVLRAFETEMGMQVIRPSIAGLMGAFGAALFGRARSASGGLAQPNTANPTRAEGPQGARGPEHSDAAGRARSASQTASSALSRAALEGLVHTVQTTNCGLCTNHCSLTINTFSAPGDAPEEKPRRYISGNRCDRPITQRSAENPLDIYDYKLELLNGYTAVAPTEEPGAGTNAPPAAAPKAPRGKIGFPMALNFFETLPFWHTMFTHLGFEVVTSPPSTRQLYFAGQATIPSDTVCYPAKLAHGHINALAAMPDVDTIFYPCMSYNIDEGMSDNCYNCPVVAYYPEVIKASCSELGGKTFIYDYVGIHREKDFVKIFHKILQKYFENITAAEVKAAATAAYAEYAAYLARVRQRGAEIIATARAEGRPIIVLAGRPYHVDSEVNHGIDRLILTQGAAVISEDCVSHLGEKPPAGVLNQWTYHARLYAAAHYINTQPDMNLVQLVSFGCGLDAVTTDEVKEILHRGGKLYTQIKIDEIANLGAVNIRLRSLFAALGDAAESPAATPAPAQNEEEVRAV